MSSLIQVLRMNDGVSTSLKSAIISDCDLIINNNVIDHSSKEEVVNHVKNAKYVKSQLLHSDCNYNTVYRWISQFIENEFYMNYESSSEYFCFKNTERVYSDFKTEYDISKLY
jgi:hypothetical protein